MKNIISKLFDMFKETAPKKTAEDILKEKAIQAAVSYAGMEIGSVAVESAELVQDNTGSLCAVSFRDASEQVSRCAMGFTAYMDTVTGEVVGFAGEAEKQWIDYPAGMKEHDAEITRLSDDTKAA